MNLERLFLNFFILLLLIWLKNYGIKEKIMSKNIEDISKSITQLEMKGK